MLRLRSDVALTPITLEHAPAMYRWACDPEVLRNVGLRREPSLERTREWITRALDDPATRPFAILCDARHVGTVVLDRIDDYVATARISIYIGDSAARGSGVGCTAMYLALAEAFERLQLHKVSLTVHVDNAAAIRTYQQLVGAGGCAARRVLARWRTCECSVHGNPRA